MKTRLFNILIFLFFAVYTLDAQDNITFRTICKKQVMVGEQFQVSYELNGADGKDFKTPNFNNFEVIGGPFSNTSSSIQITNGSVSRTSTQTYSFHLRAIKEGNFVLTERSSQAILLIFKLLHHQTVEVIIVRMEVHHNRLLMKRMKEMFF